MSNSKDDWNFCDLVDAAGYDSQNCSVLNSQSFAYTFKIREKTKTVAFSIVKLKYAKHRIAYVKTILDKASKEIK